MEIKRKKGNNMKFILEEAGSKSELKTFTEEMEKLFDELFGKAPQKAISINLPSRGVYSFENEIYELRECFILEMFNQFKAISEKTSKAKANIVTVEHSDGDLKISFYNYAGYTTADIKGISISYCNKEKYDNLIEELKEEGLNSEMIDVCKEIFCEPLYLDSKDNVIDWLKEKVKTDAENIIHAFQVGGLNKTKTLKEQELVEKFNKLKDTSLYDTAKFCNSCYINDDALAVVFLNSVIRIFQRIPVTTYTFE